jgi:hypothetical protein
VKVHVERLVAADALRDFALDDRAVIDASNSLGEPRRVALADQTREGCVVEGEHILDSAKSGIRQASR